MTLRELNILNYKNIREATLQLSDKLNCFVGLNGQGKTNVLDTIYYLSFTKSAYNAIDSQNIHHDEEMAMLQGKYLEGEKEEIVTSVKFVPEEHIDKTFYTLQGQRLNVPLNALPKGVYIVGGKKITN